MDKELTSIEKLDAVLNVLDDSYKAQIAKHITVPIGQLPLEEIILFLNNFFIQIYRYDLNLILNKLMKDDFVDQGIDSHKTVYSISIEGSVFYEQGGYQQRILEANQAKYNLSYQISLSNKLNRLTGWIAFGTSVAAVYYLLEIVKWVLSLCHSS